MPVLSFSAQVASYTNQSVQFYTIISKRPRCRGVNDKTVFIVDDDFRLRDARLPMDVGSYATSRLHTKVRRGVSGSLITPIKNAKGDPSRWSPLPSSFERAGEPSKIHARSH